MSGDRRDERHEGHHHEGDGHEGERRGPGGPQGTEWLDLEVTKIAEAQAERLVRPAAEELMKEAIKERLRERLGPRIAAIAAAAADRFVDDIEANLEIEARIAARREARRATDGRIAEALGLHRREPPPGEPPGEVSGEGWDPRKV